MDDSVTTPVTSSRLPASSPVPALGGLVAGAGHGPQRTLTQRTLTQSDSAVMAVPS